MILPVRNPRYVDFLAKLHRSLSEDTRFRDLIWFSSDVGGQPLSSPLSAREETALGLTD